MDTTRIAELLQLFLNVSARTSELCHSEQSEESAALSQAQLQHISTYIDLLLRWNARINLTAIRQPEEIVTRHFGESLFAARHLFPAKTAGRAPSPVQAERSSVPANYAPPSSRPVRAEANALTSETLIDVGSGAGFPGLPIKLWAPQIHVTLIESNHKKATFLREVVRAMTLTDVEVFSARAEDYTNTPADVVTLRAVERFKTALSTAAGLVAPTGRLALLIGETQLAHTPGLAPEFTWSPPTQIPLSSNRILVIGTRNHQGQVPR
jgi:16S rRNA (guanine527-N7)-methyltransferase